MGQKDPLVEYQREGFDMFVRCRSIIKEDFARYIFHVEAVREDERHAEPTRMREERRQIPMAPETAAPPRGRGTARTGGARREGDLHIEQAVSDKIPRNAPCPCGSGKKYKQCHGRPGAAAL